MRAIVGADRPRDYAHIVQRAQAEKGVHLCAGITKQKGVCKRRFMWRKNEAKHVVFKINARICPKGGQLWRCASITSIPLTLLAEEQQDGNNLTNAHITKGVTKKCPV